MPRKAKRKICMCEAEIKNKNVVWLAFVSDEKDCEEEERMIRERLGDAECHAIDIPRRIVLICKETSQS